MANYEEFKNQVVDQIKDHLPKELQQCDVFIQQVEKNNKSLDGLIIQDPGNPITPSIYLNSYFEDHQNGRPMDNILDEITDIRMSAHLDLGKEFDASMLTDYNQVKDQIVCHLVGSEHNQSYLNDRPHQMVEDLAVTYHVNLREDSNGTMSVPVTNQLLAAFGVSQEDLHQQAVTNTEQLYPHKFASMHETMTEIMLPDIMNSYGMDEASARAMVEEMMPPDDGNMFVLTNSTKVNGATALLNEQTMQDIAEQIGGDYFVLPSSIHEVLVVPKTVDMDYRELEAMVQEINANEVAPADRLSDHVYEYDAKDHELFRSDRAEERQAEKAAKKEKAKEKTEEKKPSVLGKLKNAQEKVNSTPVQAGPAHKKEVSL